VTLEEQLMRDEGVYYKPYRDAVGKLTIGVGRNLDDTGITKEEVMFLLRNDIARARSQLALRLPWSSALDPVRRDALTNMCFNLGIGHLLAFRNFLGALEAGDYAAAALEMLDSVWARQVGPRAHRLALQIQTGQLFPEPVLPSGGNSIT
jgi:lysozyme